MEMLPPGQSFCTARGKGAVISLWSHWEPESGQGSLWTGRSAEAVLNGMLLPLHWWDRQKQWWKTTEIKTLFCGRYAAEIVEGKQVFQAVREGDEKTKQVLEQNNLEAGIRYGKYLGAGMTGTETSYGVLNLEEKRETRKQVWDTIYRLLATAQEHGNRTGCRSYAVFSGMDKRTDPGYE